MSMAMRWGKVADGWGALLDAAARFASINDEWNRCSPLLLVYPLNISLRVTLYRLSLIHKQDKTDPGVYLL
jgi:hypothetical protein